MIQKLLLAFLLVAMFIGLIGFTGTSSMRNINTNVNNIYNNDLIAIKDISRIITNAVQIKADEVSIIDSRNKINLQTIKASIADIETINNTLILEYKTTITTDLSKQQFAKYEKLLLENLINREKVIKLVDNGDYVKASKQYGEDAVVFNNLSTDIGSSMNMVNATVSEIHKAIENVSATAEESVASSEEILASVNESFMAIEEITNATQSQAVQAEKLSGMVQKFKL
ncbi:MCP four helix bundle domain-containing protein [Clostridium estertheticum]|uniref:MCP four helix bundle domain-containing protein n=1 Tax=Clostridium estertheticum TaxID=238834 RepID=UPI001CF25977|nr:MCP four helix bundle domain-containing protein [Clostridium estertheticum]MCB2362013.1 MCP four helix bundle domain-containing protein [Clostridium estertheticum]